MTDTNTIIPAGYEEQKGGSLWMPSNSGERLEGEIRKITEGTYGQQYLIGKPTGEEFLTPSHKVLQGRLSNAKVGDFVVIIFMDAELPTVKGNNPTMIYKVGIKKKPNAPLQQVPDSVVQEEVVQQ